MAQTTPKDRQELGSLILDDGMGKIANALSKAISYDRDPELFDQDYIKERDAEIKRLQENREDVSHLTFDRRDKPVYLTSYQSRIVHALSYAISREIDMNATAKEDIQHSLRNRIPLGEAVNSRFLFNSMTMTPAKEIINPTMFIGVSLSLRKTRAAIGVTSGIMAIMADPMTGEVFFRP